MKSAWPPIIEFTAGGISDLMLFGSGVFPTHNHDGESITLTDAHKRRLKRWGRLLTTASVGYLDSDPLLEAQMRRLVAVFKDTDAVHLCGLVQCKTGDTYPA